MAEEEASKCLQRIQLGKANQPPENITLDELYKSYISTVTLKPNTLKNYNEIVGFYPADWVKKPVTMITKQMIEKRSSSVHDLRCTFATRATEVGIDYLMVKRMLNHKTNDITAQYVQWNSRQKLMMMRDALSQVVY